MKAQHSIKLNNFHQTVQTIIDQFYESAFNNMLLMPKEKKLFKPCHTFLLLLKGFDCQSTG